MGKATSTRADRTRIAILVAGETLFLKQGFGGTSMDEVSEASGVSKQTVYAHLQSKEALFLAVVDRMTVQAGDALANQMSDPVANLPVKEFLLTFARQQMEIVLSPRLMQLRRVVIGEVGRFPDLGRLLHDRGPGRSIKSLAAALSGFKQKGQLQMADTHQTASLFNWLIMGGPVNDAMLLGDGAIPGKAKQNRHASECVRVFLSAYSVPLVR
jgi:TetR/AcrR family transcriptional regulator, mexJK operon transcriptional repressor